MASASTSFNSDGQVVGFGGAADPTWAAALSLSSRTLENLDAKSRRPEDESGAVCGRHAFEKESIIRSSFHYNATHAAALSGRLLGPNRGVPRGYNFHVDQWPSSGAIQFCSSSLCWLGC